MKLDKWARLKRHAALPLAVAAAVLITLVIVDVRSAKGQGTYMAEHLQGDSSVLEDVTVSGAIVDGNHKTSFAWRGSEVSIDTEVYPYARNEWRYRYGYGFYKRIGDYYYSASGNIWGQEYSVTRQENRANRMVNYEHAAASIPVRPIVYKENAADYTNKPDYGLAAIGEEVFFTVVTTKGYKGTNGIYKLAFDPTSPYIPPDERQQSSPIMTFSLDANEDEHTGGIEVLGLESVGGKLALILVKEGALVIEGYSTSGERLGEAKVEPFSLSGRDQSGTNRVNHYESYEAYSNDESGMLSLSFLSNQSARTIVSLDFTENVRLADVTVASIEDDKIKEESEYGYNVRFITFKNGRLYYASVVRESEETEQANIYGIHPIKFMLHVYESGELVYKGELHTDINDDLIRVKNYFDQSFSYDPIEYRNIYDVRID